MTRVSLLGYGRFGAALAGLLRDAELRVRALDPHAPVPDELRAGSHSELAAGCDLLLVAVPVPAMREAFTALAPHLAGDTVVADVGSVKAAPCAAMSDVFGAARPWVGTHPLFGPTSLARGERPLRVVVCPSPDHPAAARRVGELCTRLGCQVTEQAPDEHDRAMAWTHALAFFLAKGMTDAGAPLDVPYAPPSYQAIVRTIEAVRSDAGHLFAALQRDNPYAAGMRRALLDALEAADRDLLSTAPTAALDDARLSIPELGACPPELREARELIDELDRDLVALLARRAELSRRAGRAKAEIGRAVRDPEREAQLLASRRRWAADQGIDVGAVDEVFQAILRFSRGVQRDR
jgi:prephenate dehydrogenase